MSEVNAAAALSLDIQTDLADSKLTALEARLAKLGLSGLQASAGEAGAAITRLESQVTELKQALATANIANSGLSAQLKEQSESIKKQLANTKAAAGAEQLILSEKTRNYMTHYEMVSRGARATGSSIKSMMESVTTVRPAIADLKDYYAGLEKVQRITQSEASAASAMAGRRKQEIAALTASNTELRRMAAYYGEIEQRQSAEARSAALTRNLAEKTRNYMTHFEEVSRGARASTSSIKAMMDAMTATRPEIDGLNAKYRALEMASQSENRASQAMTLRRNQEIAALTAVNPELQKMAEHYGRLEREGRRAITAGLIRPFEEVSSAAKASTRNIRSAIEAITYPHSQKSGLADYYRSLPGVQAGGGRALEAANKGVSELELLQAEKTAAAAAAVGEAKSKVIAPTKSLTAATKEATEAAGHWSKAAYQQHAFARGLAGSLGQLWMTYGTLAPLLAGAAIGAAAKSAVNLGKEFEYQLTFVKALGGESAEAIERLSAATKDISKDGMFAPTEIAGGLRILAQAGLDANQALVAVPHTLDLATAGEMKMADAAVTLVGVMNAFSMSVSQVQYIGDIFAKAAAVSQVSVADMTSAMRTASVVGEQYGASIEDTATALTLLGKVNITGTAAGTSLRNMLKELYTPLDRSAKMMAKLGLESKTAEGTMRSFPDIIYDLKERLKEFDKASQVNILQELFGERGAKEAIAMLGQTREEWDKLKSSISGSDGFMREVAAQLEQTTKGTLTQAFNALKVTMIDVFESTDGAVGALAVQLKDAFSSSELRTALEVTATLIMGITKASVTLAPVLATVATGWAAVKLAMIGASVWTSIGTAIGGAVAALSGMAGALIATTGAMGPAVAGAVGLRGALSALVPSMTALAGPIGILAAGLTGAAIWLGRLATEAANSSLVTSTRNLADAFETLAERTKSSNEALVEQLRLRGLTTSSSVGDAEYQLFQKESERNSLRQKVEETEAYVRSPRGMALGDIARPANVPFRLGELETKKAELANLDGEVGRAQEALKRAKFEHERQKDLTDSLRLQEQIDRNQSESRMQSGARSLDFEKYLEDRRSDAEELEAKIKAENDAYERVVAGLQASGATQDKFKAALEARDIAIKKIKDEASKKGGRGRVDRSSLFEQKDIAKLADTEYRTAMTSVEYEKKLLDLKRNAQLVNEREYEKGLDAIADKSVALAIEREKKKQQAISAALNAGVDPSIRDDFNRKMEQSKADLALLEAQARQEKAFRETRDNVRNQGELRNNDLALTDIAEQRRQAFEERQAQFRIEREMDPVIAEGLRARIEAGRDFEQQERALLEQLKLTNDATSEHASNLRKQYEATLLAKDAAQDLAEAQAMSEESYRRSAWVGYENVMANLADQTGNLAHLMEEGLGGSLDRASQSFVDLATTGKTSMRSMVADILNHLSKLAAAEGFKMLIQFAMQAGMAYFGSGGSFGGKVYSSNPTVSSTAGNQLGSGTSFMRTGSLYHTGGMVGITNASRSVDSSVFRDAPRYHTGGVLPGEVPIIAKKGEGVFTPEQMRALAPVDKMQKGGGDTSVVNNNVTINITEGGQRQETTNSNNSNAGKELGRQIEGAVMAVLVREKRNGGILAN